MEWITSEFKKDNGVDLKKDSQALQRIRDAAEKEIIQFVDSCMSTELCPESVTDVFCFQCKQEMLTFVNPQDLRFLRHKLGCKVHQG
mgnify:CR=1 FL=1